MKWFEVVHTDSHAEEEEDGQKGEGRTCEEVRGGKGGEREVRGGWEVGGGKGSKRKREEEGEGGTQEIQASPGWS